MQPTGKQPDLISTFRTADDEKTKVTVVSQDC